MRFNILARIIKWELKVYNKWTYQDHDGVSLLYNKLEREKAKEFQSAPNNDLVLH